MVKSDFITKTIKILLVCVFTLAATEGAFRLYHHYNPVFIFSSDDYNQFRGKPFSPYYGFPLNSLGFHDKEFSVTKDSETFRIAAIGDSFAYGVVPYERNFLTLLEKKLNEDSTNGKYEVYNFGIPSTGPKEYYEVLSKEALQYEPDLVMVFFYLGNDFYHHPLSHDKHNQPFVATFLKYLYDLAVSYQGELNPADSTYNDYAPTLSKEKYLLIEMGFTNIFIRDGEVILFTDEGSYTVMEMRSSSFYTAINTLDSINSLCKANGTDLVVVLIPDALQVDYKVRGMYYDKHGMDDDFYDWTLVNDFLIKNFRFHDIKYLDLTPMFSKGSKQQSLYKPLDTHWNIAGNELASEVIHNYLAEELREGKTDSQ